jgi:hypothetical protein
MVYASDSLQVFLESLGRMWDDVWSGVRDWF